MKIITDYFEPKNEYLNEIEDIKKDVLFFDIETTGFTYKTASVYMIGTASFQNGKWMLKQYLIEFPSNEETMLRRFNEEITQYTYLVHFNGNQFDIPFLKGKYEQYGMEHCLDEKQGIDLYQRIAPFKSLLQLSSCKQKDLEAYLGVTRMDMYSGGELINIFKEYIENRDAVLAGKLLLHNAEDVKGMLEILPLLSISHLFSDDIKVSRVYTETYHSIAAHLQKELFIKIKLSSPLFREFEFKLGGCLFRGNNDTALIRVPLLQGELKYFYSDYKDYYYFPSKDMAIHKSVSKYSESTDRQQAKASNCYTKHNSEFLPQWTVFKEPFFKTSYTSKQLYFELTDDLKRNREFFSSYASHILEMMLVTSKKRERMM